MSIKGSLRVPSAAAMALAAASSDDEEYGSDYDASTERGQDGEIEDQEDLETKAQDGNSFKSG